MAGQTISLSVTNSTYNGCFSTNITIRNPDNSTLTTGNICSATGLIADTMLSQTGTYTIFIDPLNANTGSATFQLFDATEVDVPVTIGGPSVTLTTTAPGQNGGMTFSATGGQVVSVDASSVTYPGCPAVNVRLDDPNGSAVTGFSSLCNGFSGTVESMVTLPMISGTYKIFVDPVGAGPGSITTNVTSP